MTLEFAEIDPASQRLYSNIVCARAFSREETVCRNKQRALFHTNPNGGARI